MNAFTLALMASTATAAISQTQFAIPGYKYVGCVEATPGVFSNKQSHAVSARDCQMACGASASKYAALSGGCYCDNTASTLPQDFTKVAESRCTSLCVANDISSGNCGAPIANKPFAKQVYNLYARVSNKRQDDAAAPAADPAPPAETTAPVADTTAPPAGTPSTVEVDLTTLVTITSCPPDVTDCPAATGSIAPVDNNVKTVTVTAPCEAADPIATSFTPPPPPATTAAPAQTETGQGCPAYGCSSDLPISPVSSEAPVSSESPVPTETPGPVTAAASTAQPVGLVGLLGAVTFALVFVL